MRLINVYSLKIEEFQGEKVPSYAILSHTWTGGEVSYSDWQADSHAAHLPGFQKIIRFCEIAARVYKCKYVWVDTCCIDKSSSADLSEAINSMYRYYAQAHICVVYLADVRKNNPIPILDAGLDDDHDVFRKISASRWLSRGWTLQELVAPRSVEFYDVVWDAIAKLNPNTPDVAASLSEATGIPSSVLLHESEPSMWSVAARMSWAARRITTRVEDQAYCLLGLFEVSLPLLYGEGQRAFMRLQEEIVARSTDHSIFAWNLTYREEHSHGQQNLDLLATSPAQFEHVLDRAIVPCYQDVKDWIEAFQMTNLGLSISLPLVPCKSQLGVYHAILNCSFVDERKGPIALNIRRSSPYAGAQSKGTVSFDLTTTTFAAVPINYLPYRSFECEHAHLNRLAIVEEREFLGSKKEQVTILRRDLFNIALASERRPRAALVRRATTAGRPKASSLKLMFEEVDDPRASRIHAHPPGEWDAKSHIWYLGDQSACIRFTWGEQTAFDVTFVFCVGQSRDSPFKLVVLERSEDQTVLKERPDRKAIEPLAVDFRVNQQFTCAWLFGRLTFTLLRTDALGKLFYTLRVAVERNGMLTWTDEADKNRNLLAEHRSKNSDADSREEQAFAVEGFSDPVYGAVRQLELVENEDDDDFCEIASPVVGEAAPFEFPRVRTFPVRTLTDLSLIAEGEEKAADNAVPSQALRRKFSFE